MKNKKMLSLALAVAMTATMSMSAFAAAPAAPAAPGDAAVAKADDIAAMSVETTATTAGVTMALKLPASADLVFNPYKLGTATAGQILAAKTNIENFSNTDVNIFVNSCVATMADGSNKAIKVGTAAVPISDVTNSIQLYLRAGAVAIGSDTAVPPDATKAYAVATPIKTGDVPVVLQVGTAAPKPGVPLLFAQLPKGDGDDVAGVMGGHVSAQFMGSMSVAPTIPWTSADGLVIATVYSATPTTLKASV